jgi:hypothetical protein
MKRKPKPLSSRTKPFQRSLLAALLVADPQASTFYDIIGRLPNDHAQDKMLWELSTLRTMGFIEHGKVPGTWQLTEAGRTYWLALQEELKAGAQRKFRTPDGYTFYMLPDGSLVDSLTSAKVNMTFHSLDELKAAFAGDIEEIKKSAENC